MSFLLFGQDNARHILEQWKARHNCHILQHEDELSLSSNKGVRLHTHTPTRDE